MSGTGYSRARQTAGEAWEGVLHRRIEQVVGSFLERTLANDVLDYRSSVAVAELKTRPDCLSSSYDTWWCPVTKTDAFLKAEREGKTGYLFYYFVKEESLWVWKYDSVRILELTPEFPWVGRHKSSQLHFGIPKSWFVKTREECIPVCGSIPLDASPGALASLSVRSDTPCPDTEEKEPVLLRPRADASSPRPDHQIPFDGSAGVPDTPSAQQHRLSN